MKETRAPWEYEDFFAPVKQKRESDYWKPVISPQSCIVEPHNGFPLRWVRGHHITTGSPTTSQINKGIEI